MIKRRKPLRKAQSRLSCKVYSFRNISILLKHFAIVLELFIYICSVVEFDGVDCYRPCHEQNTVRVVVSTRK